MSQKDTDLRFKIDGDGKYIFTPINQDDAEFVLSNIIEALRHFRNKVKNNEDLLDVVQNENKKQENNQFKLLIKNEILKKVAVEDWYNKKGIRLPSDPEEIEFRGKGKKLLELYIENLRKDIQNKIKGKKDWIGAIYALADELYIRKKEGEFGTCREAYKFGEKHYTVNGKNITWKQLENNLHKARSVGKL